MPKKDTEELEEALSEARDVRDYFDENADELAERTLAEELARLLAEKHLTKSLVAERSGLDRTYAYHIFDGKSRIPPAKRCWHSRSRSASRRRKPSTSSTTPAVRASMSAMPGTASSGTRSKRG